MTDLQTSLIVIGGTIVVGVISYNKWQEYKAKKSVERAFSSAHDDVLMHPVSPVVSDGERHEPSFVESPVGVTLHTPVQDDGLHAEALASDRVADAPVPQELPVDTLIDCVIPLALEAPVHGEKILPALQTLRHVGNKPVSYIGLRNDGHWDVIVHGAVYSALQAGVQMANRSNALNELEYSELVMQLRQIADGLGAEPDVPDMVEVITIAKSLHRFIVERDAQLGINVHTNGAPWAISTLLMALEKQGFNLRPDGRFVMPDGDGGSLFSLSTNVSPAAETTSRLTLLLNVPCSAPADDGFGAIVACARSLALRLDGTVVDDSNQPLTDAALAEIASQVNAFHDDMQAVEIAAGSTRALRLFS